MFPCEGGSRRSASYKFYGLAGVRARAFIVPPAVSFHFTMNVAAIVVITNLVWAGSADLTLRSHAAVESPPQTSSMIRREPYLLRQDVAKSPKNPYLRHEIRDEKAADPLADTSHLMVRRTTELDAGESALETVASVSKQQQQDITQVAASTAGKPSRTIPRPRRHPMALARKKPPQSKRRKGGEAPSKASPKASSLIQEEEVSDQEQGLEEGGGWTKGMDQKNYHPNRLSDEDEQLYDKLFPEEKEVEDKDAASALEVSSQKAFRIKVPSGGLKLCLTEDTVGHMVRAEPCRRSELRQKWYWVGKKLKNLYSKSRCLGMERHKHHISFQTESFIEMQQGKAEAEAQGHHLSMSFKCSDEKAPLDWVLNKQGRLMSDSNKQCMAILEQKDDHKAVVLPCGTEPAAKTQ